MLTTISFESQEAKLARDIRKFDTDLTSHNVAVEELSKPPAFAVEDVLKFTGDVLKSEQRKRLDGRLGVLRNAVQLWRRRAALLEACQPELDVIRAKADKELPKVRTATIKALNAGGVTVEATQAGRMGQMAAAERQFEHLVRQSDAVQAAEKAAKMALDAETENKKAVRRATEATEAAEQKLVQFVTQAIAA